MDRPKHSVGYHYAQQQTAQTYSGQRNADKTHGTSSVRTLYSPVHKTTCRERGGSDRHWAVDKRLRFSPTNAA
jgi:hypothetical protein